MEQRAWRMEQRAWSMEQRAWGMEQGGVAVFGFRRTAIERGFICLLTSVLCLLVFGCGARGFELRNADRRLKTSVKPNFTNWHLLNLLILGIIVTGINFRFE